MSDIWHDPLFLAALKKGGAGGTASGDIVTFNAPKAAPLKSLTLAIDPVQDLHGYDNPWPAGGGANKWNGKFVASNFVELDAFSSPCYAGNNAMPITVGSTYTASINGTAAGIRYVFLDSTFTAIGDAVNAVTTAAAPSNAVYLRWRIRDEATADGKYQIESGSTASAWTPYSNLCPISGWDGAQVWRCGRNLWNPTLYVGCAYNPSIGATFDTTPHSTQFTDNHDGTFSLTTSATWRYFGLLCPLHDGKNLYRRFSFSSTGQGGTTQGFLDADFKVLYRDNRTDATQTWSGGLNWSSYPDAKYYFAVLTNRGTASTTLTVTEPQIELSSTATPYTPYTGTTIPVTFTEAGTVYGGEWDVIGGVLRVDREYLYKTSCAGFSSTVAGCFYVLSNNGVEKQPGLAISNYLKTHNGSGNSAVQPFYSVTQSGGGSTTIWGRLDESYTTKAAVDAYLSQNPLVVVVKLATPIEYTLTPAQLDTLAGQNVVWGDAGEVDLEYAGGGVSKDMMLAAILHEARQ